MTNASRSTTITDDNTAIVTIAARGTDCSPAGPAPNVVVPGAAEASTLRPAVGAGVLLGAAWPPEVVAVVEPEAAEWAGAPEATLREPLTSWACAGIAPQGRTSAASTAARRRPEARA